MHPILAWLPHGSDWVWIFVFAFFLGPIGSIIWIAALFSCIKNESPTDNTKIVWVLVILFTHFVGALIYFLVRRPERIRELGH